MEFLNFLKKTDPQSTQYILLSSIIYGIASGVFAPLILNAASKITAGKSYTVWIFLLFGCVALQLIAYWFAEIRTLRLTNEILEKMVLEIADTLRRDELVNFEKRDQAEIRLCFDSVNNISDGTVYSIKMFQSMITILVIWLYIFSLTNIAGIIFLLVYCLIILANELLCQISKEHAIVARQTESRLFKIFHHFLHGFKEIRIDSIKNHNLFKSYLKPVIRKLKTVNYKMSFIETEFGMCIQAALFITIGAYAFFLPALGYSGSILPLLACTFYVVKPSIIIFTALPRITAAKASLMLLSKITGDRDADLTRHENMHKPERELFHPIKNITLENISFSYVDPGQTRGFSIGPIRLSVSSGEIVFIAGGNGSGKSTLLKVMTGLYPPASGTISVNGKEIQHTQHRYLISAIFNDFHLFDTLYGTDQIDDQKINDLLECMELAGKTSWAEGKFSTLHLSAGQRRRLAMVASLSEDKQIYVFDEWAADQDPKFRLYFYEKLLPSLKKQNKIVIVVSHDDKYYHLADRVIFMKDGMIVNKTDFDSKDTGNSAFFFPKTSFTKTHEKSTDTDLQSLSSDTQSPANFRQYKSVLYKVGAMIITRGFVGITMIHILFEVMSSHSALSEIRLFFLFITFLLLDIHLSRHTDKIISDNIQTIIGNVRAEIIDRVRKVALTFFEKIGVAPVYTSLTTDLRILNIAVHMLISTFSFLVRTVFLLFYFAFIAYPIFIISMGISGVVAIFFFRNQIEIKNSMERLRKKEIAFFDSITHLLDGFKELRLNDKKNDSLFHKIKLIASQVSASRVESGKYNLLNVMLVYTTWTAILALIPLAYPFAGISSDSLLKCVTIVSFIPINAFILLIPPMVMAVDSGKRLQDMIKNLIDAEQDLIVETPPEDQVHFHELQCKDLVFSYSHSNGDGQFSVGPMNLNIKAGELIYISGGNGSGKSTLIKLITGLYKPNSGKILLNAEPVDIRKHRYLYSVIFSDFHLFDRMYSLPDADSSRVEYLINLMQLQGKVEFKDGKFNTKDLSTGQKKRLALVMAMMEDKPVYIFDEWAAEQDPHFRSFFYETLLPGLKADGKSVIAVTHHDQYFHLADRVVKMEYGRVVGE